MMATESKDGGAGLSEVPVLEGCPSVEDFLACYRKFKLVVVRGATTRQQGRGGGRGDGKRKGKAWGAAEVLKLTAENKEWRSNVERTWCVESTRDGVDATTVSLLDVKESSALPRGPWYVSWIVQEDGGQRESKRAGEKRKRPAPTLLEELGRELPLLDPE